MSNLKTEKRYLDVMRMLCLMLISAAILGTAAAQTTEGFGSGDGVYNVNYDANNSTFLGNETNRVADVTTERQYTSFIGYVEVPDVCTEIERKFEETDSELVMKLDTYSTGENCTEHGADIYQKYNLDLYRKYNFEMKSEEPFRLEVRHNGKEVRTIETSTYGPDSAGLLQEIIDIIMRFF